MLWLFTIWTISRYYVFKYVKSKSLQTHKEEICLNKKKPEEDPSDVRDKKGRESVSRRVGGVPPPDVTV